MVCCESPSSSAIKMAFSRSFPSFSRLLTRLLLFLSSSTSITTSPILSVTAVAAGASSEQAVAVTREPRGDVSSRSSPDQNAVKMKTISNTVSTWGWMRYVYKVRSEMFNL